MHACVSWWGYGGTPVIHDNGPAGFTLPDKRPAAVTFHDVNARCPVFMLSVILCDVQDRGPAAVKNGSVAVAETLLLAGADATATNKVHCYSSGRICGM